MAELVDAQVSGTCGRKVVEVRVFFWAPFPSELTRATSKTTQRFASRPFGPAAHPRLGIDRAGHWILAGMPDHRSSGLAAPEYRCHTNLDAAAKPSTGVNPPKDQLSTRSTEIAPNPRNFGGFGFFFW
jgi:hypothetical protein